jgi:hypothetical protein
MDGVAPVGVVKLKVWLVVVVSPVPLLGAELSIVSLRAVNWAAEALEAISILMAKEKIKIARSTIGVWDTVARL